MSRAILWVGLVLAASMILMGLSSGKVLPLLFWALIGAGSAYKLFKPAPEAS